MKQNRFFPTIALSLGLLTHCSRETMVHETTDPLSESATATTQLHSAFSKLVYGPYYDFEDGFTIGFHLNSMPLYEVTLAGVPRSFYFDDNVSLYEKLQNNQPVTVRYTDTYRCTYGPDTDGDGKQDLLKREYTGSSLVDIIPN